MSLRTLLMFVTLVTSVALSPRAHAAWWHELGRSAGLGWSDGYHSRNACVKRRSPCPQATQPVLRGPSGNPW